MTLLFSMDTPGQDKTVSSGKWGMPFFSVTVGLKMSNL